MKLAPHRFGRRRAAAITLVECLVYISALLLIFNLAAVSYGKFIGYSRDFHRNADDIVRVVKAGERWRADVRRADTIERLESDGAASLKLSGPGGEVRYTRAGDVIWREAGTAGGRQEFLRGVQQSEFVPDRRARVSAWRWEVKLKSTKSAVRVRPLFSFTAVPDREVKP